MTRGIPIALALLFLLLAGIVIGGGLAHRPRSHPAAACFASERLVQVEETADLTRRDLDGMAIVLRLAGELTQGYDRTEVQSRELEALLAASEELRLLRVFGPRGKRCCSRR